MVFEAFEIDVDYWERGNMLNSKGNRFLFSVLKHKSSSGNSPFF